MKIFGQHEEKTLLQFEHVRTQAVNAALMADGHVGYVMPIGGVATYRNQVSVVGVGFDIACGNAAIRTDLTLDSLGRKPNRVTKEISALADEIAGTVSSVSGGRIARTMRRWTTPSSTMRRGAPFPPSTAMR
jgi:tRNA-splicing ligase RtcB